MQSDLNAYGLLYVDPGRTRPVNIHGRQNAIDVYLLCAANCSRSFRQLGTAFKLITNKRTLLVERLPRLNIVDLEIVEHKFVLSVPTGIPFFSAHFKLELFDAFAKGEYGSSVAIVDIDTLLLRPLPVSENLSVYDISDHVFPAYGRDNVIRDLTIVTGKHLANGRWYGGEFVMGEPDQFAELAACIKFCWPKYVENIEAFHHLGDEMVLSAALNLYSENYRLSDYGAQGNVARWWSSRTLNKQAPFSDVRNVALLHLPADKPFLAKLDPKKLTKQTMLDEYQKHIRRKLLIRSMAPDLGLFSSRHKKFNPRIA
jgi:hypothetical protein